MPISRYGLLMSSTTFKANRPQASMLPAAWLNGLPNYYAWVAAVIAIHDIVGPGEPP
ncbi:MAG: hypothetical protein RXQ79_07210 [Acidilobus sp.]